MAAARDGIDVLLRDRGLRRTPAAATADSLLRGAHASAVLAGSASSFADVAAGAGDEVAQAAVRVSTELLGLVPVVRRSPLQAFARVHAVAATGSARGSAAASGSPGVAAGASGGVFVPGAGGDPSAPGAGAPDVAGPSGAAGRPRDAASAQRLQEVGRWLLARDPAVPALVLAAVVHAELATGSPFGSFDGILARAVERLVLVASGVDEKSLVVPEAGHLAHRAAYESNLRAWAAGTPSGRHAWLLYAAEAYAAGAEASPLRDA
jgi:hypothetical protein